MSEQTDAPEPRTMAEALAEDRRQWMNEQTGAPAPTVGALPDVLAEMRDHLGRMERLGGSQNWHPVPVETYDAWLATLASVEGVLRQLVADEWGGWSLHDNLDIWECFWCNGTVPYQAGAESAPTHTPTCPVLVARRLLAGGQ